MILLNIESKIVKFTATIVYFAHFGYDINNISCYIAKEIIAMTELEPIASALHMLSQPAAVSIGGRIVVFNCAAVKAAGTDLTGKRISDFLPVHIVNTQADMFISTAFVFDRYYTVKVSSCGEYRFYILSPDKALLDKNIVLLASLRTAVSNLKFASGCISIIAENDANEQLQLQVRSLNHSYHSIKHTLDNINTLMKINSGCLPFNPEPLDLNAFFGAITDAVGFLIEKQDIRISFHAQDNFRAVADRALLEQLMLNLISNSVKHCTGGCRISISLLKSSTHVIISVVDDGEGLSSDELSFLFDSGAKIPDITSPVAGAGLGLAIVRAIAEKHDGAIIVESKGQGHGTSVRIMLSNSIAPGSGFSSKPVNYRGSDLQRIITAMSDCLTIDCFSNLPDD